MTTFRLAVEKALTGVGPFQPAIAVAILEIAYLTMAIDEELRDEEIDAFSVIAARLLGKDGGSEGLDGPALTNWLDRFAQDLDRQSIPERLEKAVESLGADKAHRITAYRVACLMAMSDMDAADREFEFDLELIAILTLTQEEADQVADEVNAALAPPAN